MTPTKDPPAWRRIVKRVAPPLLLDAWRAVARRPVSALTAGFGETTAEFSLPTYALADVFPGIGADLVQVRAGDLERSNHWLLPLTELLTLAAICKHLRPTRVFEFGTFVGSATLAMADNTPPDTEIYTLDLDPSARVTHRHGLGIGGFPDFQVGERFVSKPATRKIRQLLGDSQSFDFSPFAGSMDLVFVDADHSYDFVKRDSENAFRLIRHSGVIVWDDYRWHPSHPECAGVTRVLDELADTRECFALAGTRFAVYRDGLKIEKR